MPTQVEKMTARAAAVMRERHVAAPYAAAVACTEFGGGEGEYRGICQTLGQHGAARARVAATERHLTRPLPRLPRYTEEQIAAARSPFKD
jgi:hypothetical protein